jgi:hypothetical protein
MTTNFIVSGRGDLDSLFMAYASGAQYGASGYVLTGYGDIGYRFQLIGAGTPIAATGFKIGATDFASLFRGISDPLFPLTSMTVTSTVNGAAAICQYSLAASGDINATQGTNTLVDVGDWVSPKTGMTGYEVLWIVSGGPLTSNPGPAGTWIALGSGAITWTRSQFTVGNSAAQITIKIRRTSDLVEVISGIVITLQAFRPS